MPSPRKLMCAATLQAADPDAEWDWMSFRVAHPSLERELFVGGYYLRLLLETLESEERPLKVSQCVLPSSLCLCGDYYVQPLLEALETEERPLKVSQCVLPCS